tara:strand:+ start:68 stop:865 length:798 start_codon:yes stop_codon:yes gene_type:complete
MKADQKLLILKRFKNRIVFLGLSLKKIPDLIIEIFSIKSRERVLTKSFSNFWGDNLASRRFIGIYQDPKFKSSKIKALENIPESLKKNIIDNNIDWRFHIVNWAANHCKSLEGDFLEFGVYYGFLARSMCQYIDFENLDKSFYLFDTWGNDDASEKYKNDIFEEVKKRFINYQNVFFHRGLLPGTLKKLSKLERISYMSLDLNDGKIEREILEFTYSKIVKGGVVYIDDYGWNYPELRRELNDFLIDKDETLLHFPNGSTILIKS